jgi:hypothetical protein
MQTFFTERRRQSEYNVPSSSSTSRGGGIGESRQGQQLVGSHVDDVVGLEAGTHNARIHFNGNVHVLNFPQNFIHLANPTLVFKVHAGIKVGHLFRYGPPADQFGFAIVNHPGGLNDLFRRTLVSLKPPSSSSRPPTAASAPSSSAVSSSSAATATATSRHS